MAVISFVEHTLRGGGTAPAPGGAGVVTTYQPVTAAAAQAGYTITRSSGRILVRLTEDLTAAGSFVPDATASWVDGDVIEVRRAAGGFFDWTGIGLGIKLGYRGDGVDLTRNGSGWILVRVPGRDRARRESVGRTFDIDDGGAIIAATAAGTWTLPDAVGISTAFKVTLLQRGTQPATLALGGGLTQVGGISSLVTAGDGQALLAEAIGNSQIRVSRLAVHPAATVIVQPGDADANLTEPISGRHVLVLYTDALTADRAVLIHNTVGSPGLITVVHGSTGGFSVSVEIENSPDVFDVVADVAQGQEYVAAINTAGEFSQAHRGPGVAGALAYLDMVGAAQLSPAAISGLPEITSLAAGDYHAVWDATDSALKRVRNDHVGGAGGSVPTPSVVPITATTHLLTSEHRAHLNVLLLVDNTNQACVITVPDSAAAGDAWRVRSRTTNTITIQRQTNGTVNGGTSVTMTGTGKEAKIEVESNAGTAPVTTVEGETAEASTLDGALNLNAQTINPGTPTPVVGARTYLAADSGKAFNVTTAGTQTIPAGLGAGWTVDIWNDTASSLTIAGATNATLAAGQVATVKFLTATKVRVALGDSIVIRT